MILNFQNRRRLAPSTADTANAFQIVSNLISKLDWKTKSEDRIVQQMLIEFRNTVALSGPDEVEPKKV